MDSILNYNLEDTEDYYILLGCDELSSVEQILAEFKVRALECHPDKHPENSKAGFSDVNCLHLRFRWSGDAPSELLRKFRNYEI
nr:dnaJ homolog subfamily C member 12 [Manis javanica]XP_036866794.1 dnaJ homolog subfamily C member 12 [Manis javanica]